MKKHKTKIIWGVIILALVGLMFWGGQSSSAETWQDTDVDCLPSGHQGLAFHIHADLSVFVDGQQQTIPANTGISRTCMAEVHTHDASGYIHIESTDRNAVLTVHDFFKVWDQPIEREGYKATVMVNGEEADFDYEWRDGDDVQVMFESDDSDGEAEETSTTTDEQDESATSAEAAVEVDVDATTTAEE